MRNRSKSSRKTKRNKIEKEHGNRKKHTEEKRKSEYHENRKRRVDPKRKREREIVLEWREPERREDRDEKGDTRVEES